LNKPRIALICLLFVILAARVAGEFLVIDEPRNSDVILVLAGETDRRPARALELYRHGYAGKIIFDVPATARIYAWTQLELTQKYIETLPETKSLSICPIQGLSTKDEARDAASCLQAAGAHDVLLVTSDFHTRRALSIFRKEVPDRRFSVAAAFDLTQFGVRWWYHRQWAKVCLDEWLRLAWWEVVDQFRR
jgi:DUF218 domain